MLYYYKIYSKRTKQYIFIENVDSWSSEEEVKKAVMLLMYPIMYENVIVHKLPLTEMVTIESTPSLENYKVSNETVIATKIDTNLGLEYYGKLAFEAYRANANFTTYDGKPIPDWSELSDKVKENWINAAKAVANDIMKEIYYE